MIVSASPVLEIINNCGKIATDSRYMEKVHKIYAKEQKEENYESGRLAAVFVVLVPSTAIRNIYTVSFFHLM